MKKLFACLLTFLILISSLSAFSEFASYRVQLSAGTPIYKGPGIIFGYSKDVSVDGVYTIVEEVMGEDWLLWGRLKSGAGWVCLSGDPTQGLNANVPYTMSIPAWASIFEGPGYDYVYKKPVGEDGVYTIILESYDEDGRIWGRLKSGAGWVCLTSLEEAYFQPVIVSFADDELLKSGDYVFRSADPSEYSVKIAVRANNTVKNLRFESLSYEGEFWKTDKTLYSARTLRENRPLVIEVTFWGDMTGFALGFEDENGEDHQYLIFVSGRNGSLEVIESIME